MRPDLRLVTAERPVHRAAPVPLLGGLVRYRSADRRRIAGPRPDDLADHLDRHGHRPSGLGRAGAELIAAMAAAALTGRGGAHFPAVAKWRAVLAAGGGGYVVANAAEGEPASAKDTALLQHRPHLVLDGLAAAAEALGATGSVLWLHDTAHDTHLAVSRALTERRAARLAEPPVRVLSGPEHYLTGESSAVLNGIAGAPALPAFRRIPAARSGLHGRPTLVQNVETLARIALLARGGAAAATGGPLVTVVSGGTLTVCEPPPHVTLDGLLWHLGLLGPGIRPPRAALFGGYGGAWASWPAMADRTLGRLDGRRPDGRRGPYPGDPEPSLGAGVIAPLPRDGCGLGETAAVLGYLARSSAGQCGPCVFGTRDLAEAMARLAAGRARRAEIGRLHRLLGEVDGRGACALPDGATRLARTALEVFPDDLDHHLSGRRHRGAAAVLPVPGAGR
ncbi:NADH-ubiquinone oxidoreductase-F iron-sulfur binding region domain-containing protein [Actinoplanes sp. NPDC049599]|uniref:NADH-ubiquinone oxidoreductase-F iron-sulfur binding region domain-containing protein n=1 Tax=Actinoplanes sp. NPDC049599 TaxID=3363903 RepID=UPI0037A904A9